MLNLPNLDLFLAATLILLLTPGPAVLYIVGRSLDQGRLAGFVSVLGIEAGNFVHVMAAALGLSAILVSSALAFAVVKYLGAAYLVYLGIRQLLSPAGAHRPTVLKRQRLAKIFRQGMIVAVLNPKTALFFFAFLPQFVDASKGAVTSQLLSLGGLFVLMAVVTDGMYSLLAGTAGRWFKGNSLFLRSQRYVVGSLYVGLGVTAGLADTNL